MTEGLARPSTTPVNRFQTADPSALDKYPRGPAHSKLIKHIDILVKVKSGERVTLFPASTVTFTSKPYYQYSISFFELLRPFTLVGEGFESVSNTVRVKIEPNDRW